ncbi:TetR/AcrR family transcriptional regulator [Methylopila henanensis]|uniref:TetR/AcrR family transcriptional regulator n=1 Tax=Methylopila henanensis TaxID=873516 RepID=A0ABW4KCF7_9HYPH
MARKPSNDAKPDPNAPTPEAAAASPERAIPEPKGGDPREKVVDALLALLAERRWGEIGLFDIAEKAGVSLAELRALFPSKGAILAGFVRRIDLEVLAGRADDLVDEPARERLFDVLMRRFEALAPHRAALRAVRRGLSVDPLGAGAMNQVAVSSMQWMLAAAGVQESGPLGAARAQALVLANARVFDVFLDDDDPGLARTMKALDEQLRKAERWARRADDVGRLTAPFRGVCGRILGRASERRRDEAADDVATAA